MYHVKPDITHKVRLFCDGSRVDPRRLSTRAIVVKGVSVRLPDIIVDSQNLKTMKGDICNAFIQTHTKETIYTKYGP